MDYYITYHIDIEATHQDKLLELLNSCRLETLEAHKPLSDIYYTIDDNILCQHCTTTEGKPFKKYFPMLNLNDQGFGQYILAQVTYDELNDWDVFQDDSLCALHVTSTGAWDYCGAMATFVEPDDITGPRMFYGIYTNRDEAIATCHNLFTDGYSPELTITMPNKPVIQLETKHVNDSVSEQH